MNKPGKAIRRMWENTAVKEVGIQASQWSGRLWIVAKNCYGKIIDYYLTDHQGDLIKTIFTLKEKRKS